MATLRHAFLMPGILEVRGGRPIRPGVALAAAQGGTQGHLGPWSEAVAAQAFRVDAIPAILLIGPDGRVLATQLRREQIRSAVATALARE